MTDDLEDTDVARRAFAKMIRRAENLPADLPDDFVLDFARQQLEASARARRMGRRQLRYAAKLSKINLKNSC